MWIMSEASLFCICPAPWRVAPFYYTGLLEQEVSCHGRLFPGSLHTRSWNLRMALEGKQRALQYFFFFSGKHTEANFSFLIKLTQPLTLANVTTTHFQQTIVCIPASHWKQMCLQNWPLFPLQDWACHCSEIWKAFLPNWRTNQVFFQISDYKLSWFLKKKSVLCHSYVLIEFWNTIY